MADLTRVEYLLVNGWRFQVADDGDTIYMDAFPDEQGELRHLATSFPSAEFVQALWDMGARMPLNRPLKDDA